MEITKRPHQRPFFIGCTPNKCGSWLACDAHRYLHNFLVVAVNGNHDAKRVALDLALLLISGAPLNHAGGTQA
ncbi:hypothetical protein E1K68_10190 [Pseudomonas sp. B2021]|nr:hypothetical protein [Pseudomonas sp. B2021]